MISCWLLFCSKANGSWAMSGWYCCSDYWMWYELCGVCFLCSFDKVTVRKELEKIVQCMIKHFFEPEKNGLVYRDAWLVITDGTFLSLSILFHYSLKLWGTFTCFKVLFAFRACRLLAQQWHSIDLVRAICDPFPECFINRLLIS